MWIGSAMELGMKGPLFELNRYYFVIDGIL